MFFVLFAIVEPPEIGWAVAVFAIAALSDWWDGRIARAMNLTSPLGAFLDPLADKLLTDTAFIAFAWSNYIPWWMVAIVLARDVFVTLLRILSERRGTPLRTSYFAKVKTFAQMTFIVLILASLLGEQPEMGVTARQLGKGFFTSDLVLWLMGIVTVLTFASAVLYGYDNRRVLRSQPLLSPQARHESV